jgi:hypothetical protein
LYPQEKLEVFAELGRTKYIKLLKAGTNPRGVEMAGKALKLLINHSETLKI